MKTLMVGNFASDTGYAWTFIERFWSILAQESESSVVLYPKVRNHPDWARKHGVVVRGGDFHSNDCLRIIRDHKIDTVYLSDRQYFDPWYFTLRRAGVERIIDHDHAGGYRPPCVGIKGAVKAVRNRVAPVTVDEFFVPSAYIRDRAKSNGRVPGKKITIIPNGIDPIPERPKKRERLSCVSVARCSPIKNLSFLVRIAFARPDIDFTHYGDGPELEFLRSVAPSNLHFVGHQDVRPLLPSFHFAIHPSLGEVGYCLSMLECMSAGLPILVSNEPSVCQAVTHAHDGFIYASFDHALSCIDALRDNETRSEMGEMAALTVSDRYHIRQTEAAFKLAIKGGSDDYGWMDQTVFQADRVA